ncbi:NHL repeat-containing protein [Rathayibacter soli]|uniref:hypothetical protein n=1 Tax=Rathayibacter soli TaxID=3144168 RepID=UPI0027E4516C|nr:hypothetical protein [Glaciibacter superstes]
MTVNPPGVVYIADLACSRIREITPSGVVTTLAGSSSVGCADATGAAAQFNAPAGITVDSSGTIYVADESNNLIRIIK